jgi:sugar lactone lactonase YvrE
LLLPLAAAGQTHLDHRDEALAAYARRDYAAALAATEAALALRPDSPRYLRQLAALSALTGNASAAIACLERIAALGVSADVERDRDFALLQGTPEFRRVLAVLAANRAPQGAVEALAELPGRTGLVEGIACRERTGDIFLGDVHHRCVWRRDATGRVERFSAEDEELLGVFGLALDESRGLLWAATAAVPEMDGFTSELAGQAALAAFSLATSELVRVVHVPVDGRPHGLGDLTVAPDGTVYTTDSKSPLIWKLAPGAEELQVVADAPIFSSLQGLVLDDRILLVADHDNGLFTVALDSGDIRAVPPPPGATLVGLDGLVAIPGGVVAVQNGVEPQRLLRLSFAPGFSVLTRLQVLAAGQPQLSDLALVTLVKDRPTVIAGAGWDGYDPARTKSPPVHTVRLFQAPLSVE